VLDRLAIEPRRTQQRWAGTPFHKRASGAERARGHSRKALIISYRRRAACFATTRTESRYPVAEPRRWSFSLVRSKGPGDGDGIARDQARLARVAAGDEAAFAGIVADETPRLLRFVGSMLGSGQAETEEIVQEAMIRLWQQAETWQPDGRISTWLHRVTYRLAIDVLRRRRPTVGIETVEDTLEDDGPEPVAVLIRVEDVKALRAAVDSLPERQRTAIALCHFQGLSQAEAAAVMEVSEAAYESLLSRARRRLRVLLADES
jgi:RNA polymerase sigma-70 factor (ECF subfamily)